MFGRRDERGWSSGLAHGSQTCDPNPYLRTSLFGAMAGSSFTWISRRLIENEGRGKFLVGLSSFPLYRLTKLDGKLESRCLNA